MLNFFSSRPNWDYPTPSPAGERVLPPFGSGGGTHSLAGEEVGGSQFRRGDRHCGTLGKYCISLPLGLVELFLCFRQKNMYVFHRKEQKEENTFFLLILPFLVYGQVYFLHV